MGVGPPVASFAVRTRLAALLAVAVLPLLAVALASCSRSSDITLAEWLSRADAICARAQEKADADPVDSPLPGEALRVTATRTADEVDQLRALPSPDQNKAAVGDYLRSLDRRIEVLRAYADDVDKVPAGGQPPVIDKLVDATQDSVTQAVALGLESCAGGVDFTLQTTTTTSSLLPGETTPVPTAIGGQPENEENTVDEAG